MLTNNTKIFILMILGDKIVITSTDFDWKQAEEKTIISVSGSTVRVKGMFYAISKRVSSLFLK